MRLFIPIPGNCSIASGFDAFALPGSTHRLDVIDVLDLATEHFHDQDRNIHRIALRANEFELRARLVSCRPTLTAARVLGKNAYLSPTQRYRSLVGVT
jgi:hypothetical protein